MGGGGFVFQTPAALLYPILPQVFHKIFIHSKLLQYIEGSKFLTIHVIAGKICKIPCHDMTEILPKLKLNNTIIIILESGQHDTICTIIQRI